MQSFILAVEAIIPIFILLLVGYFLKCIKITDKKGFDAMNTLGFKVFLPVLLFYNIYKNDSIELFDTRLIAFVVLGTLAIFGIGLLGVMLITKDNAKRGVMLQASFRSNFAILGVPLVGYICGEGSGALAALMVAVVVPVFNVLSVISLEIFRGNTIKLGKVLKGIAQNPLIIACVLGLIFLGFNIKLPSVLETSVKDLSKVASPLAIVVLGASFNFSELGGYVKENIIVVSTRLIIVPAVMLTLGALLGFTGEAFCCLIVIFGAPVAVSSYAMAQQMGGDEKLAAQVVVLTSAICVVTLFAWIFIFSSLGVI